MNLVQQIVTPILQNGHCSKQVSYMHTAVNHLSHMCVHCDTYLFFISGICQTSEDVAEPVSSEDAYLSGLSW